MRTRVAIVYNEPVPSRYSDVGEEKAVLGILDAVEAVQRALLETGYHVVRVPLVPPLERAKRELESLHTDLVFNLFEGFCGYPETEALVPEILLQTGIPCTGGTGSMLSLALDKAKVKVILKTAGIQTPDFQLLRPETLHMFQLNYPCIVKPRGEDASHGLSEKSVVHDFSSLKEQVSNMSNFYGGQALVEEFIDGREFNATVMGNSECTTLPVSEITYSVPPEMPRILTFAAKWEPDSIYFQSARTICPANVGEEERQHIAETAVAAFRLLGGRGYGRVDMRIDQKGLVNVIEMNPNPDISPGSGAVLQAEAAGMTYTHFIGKLVELALEKKQQWTLISVP